MSSEVAYDKFKQALKELLELHIKDKVLDRVRRVNKGLFADN